MYMRHPNGFHEFSSSSRIPPRHTHTHRVRVDSKNTKDAYPTLSYRSCFLRFIFFFACAPMSVVSVTETRPYLLELNHAVVDEKGGVLTFLAEVLASMFSSSTPLWHKKTHTYVFLFSCPVCTFENEDKSITASAEDQSICVDGAFFFNCLRDDETAPIPGVTLRQYEAKHLWFVLDERVVMQLFVANSRANQVNSELLLKVQTLEEKAARLQQRTSTLLEENCALKKEAKDLCQKNQALTEEVKARDYETRITEQSLLQWKGQANTLRDELEALKKVSNHSNQQCKEWQGKCKSMQKQHQEHLVRLRAEYRATLREHDETRELELACKVTKVHTLLSKKNELQVEVCDKLRRLFPRKEDMDQVLDEILDFVDIKTHLQERFKRDVIVDCLAVFERVARDWRQHHPTHPIEEFSATEYVDNLQHQLTIARKLITARYTAPTAAPAAPTGIATGGKGTA